MSREDTVGQRLSATVAPVFRLVLPILLLVTLGAAAIVYIDTPIPGMAGLIGDNSWLSSGLALLPATLFAIHLTNRRYGPSYAMWQVIGAWTAAGAAVVVAQGDVSALTGQAIPLTREIAAFAAALFAGQLAAVVVFDRLRGPHWWQAPLFASLFGGIVLCLLAFPGAYAGTPVDWTARMATYLEFVAAISIAGVIPYWLLRPLLPPMPGFGGY